MNQTRFDQSSNDLAGSTGRRDAVRALGAIGAALLAALGLTQGAAAKQHGNGGQGRGHGPKHRGNDRHRNRNRTHHRHRGVGQHGPAGPADDGTQGGTTGASGPAGPEGTVQAAGKRKPKRGPTGPTGPAGTTLATRRVVSPLSDPLPVTAGASVNVTADCGGEGKLVACGYQMSASAAQLVNAFVKNVGPQDDELSQCTVLLQRTTDVGSTAGAQILAVATCLN